MRRTSPRSGGELPADAGDLPGAGPVLSRILLWLALGACVGMFWREIIGLVVRWLR